MRDSQRPLAIPEIDILWITAGLGCDGDSIAMTAASQPSIEEIVLGAIPGIPKVRLHNPVLAFENGAEFLERFHQAAEGRLSPFILVIEGSVPNEEQQGSRLLGGLRHRQSQWAADSHLRVDRLAGPQGLGRRGHRHLRHLWRHSRHGRKSHRLHGAARLSRLAMEVVGRHSDRLHSRLPGAAR